jgi:ABC-type sugar transport system permease subunit
MQPTFMEDRIPRMIFAIIVFNVWAFVGVLTTVMLTALSNLYLKN